MNYTVLGFIITIISSLITIGGFIIMILQIIKTKKISNDAYTAASEAKMIIKSTIVISDLSTIVKSMQEIQNDILNEKNDLAYLHTKDIVHSLIEIRQIINSMDLCENDIISEMIAQLGGILRRQLEVSISKKEKIDILNVNQKLSEFELSLSELVAKIKFPLTEANK